MRERRFNVKMIRLWPGAWMFQDQKWCWALGYVNQSLEIGKFSKLNIIEYMSDKVVLINYVFGYIL